MKARKTKAQERLDGDIKSINALQRLCRSSGAVFRVYADGCLMCETKDVSEALYELARWSCQLQSALPSMGDRVKWEVCL